MTQQNSPKGKESSSVRMVALNKASSALEKADNLLSASRAMPHLEDLDHAFEQAGALEPPYAVNALLDIYEKSSALPQNIKAMATNIDGFGYHLEPVIDLAKEDADTKVAGMIRVERAQQAAGSITYVGDGRLNIDPTDEEIAERKRQLAARMRLEESLINLFFDSCAREISFTSLRKETREEREITANAYWEVLRDEFGRIESFKRIPSYSMRLMPIDMIPTVAEAKVRISATQIGVKKIIKNFRRFVQVAEGRTVYFKEFNDPRCVDALTGRYYLNNEALQAEIPGAIPASEIIHFSVTCFHSPYGIPRWIGTLLAVLGTTAAEEVNYLYFDNKSIPPMALLVSGAHVSDETVKSISEYLETEFKGRTNFHKLLVLEAETSAMSGAQSSQVRMTLQPLTSAQQQDGLFLKYLELNRDFIGQAYRLPRIITGNTKDFNRASLEGAIRFAEQQVFQPERTDFDDFINRILFLEMGWSTWKFVSNSPATTDPQTLATMVASMTQAGILTPEDARNIATQIFNQEITKLNAAWTKQPLTVTMAMLGQGLIKPDQLVPSPQSSREYREQKLPRGNNAPSEASENQQDKPYTPEDTLVPGQEVRQPNAGQIPMDNGDAQQDLGTEVLAVPSGLWGAWFPGK